MEDTLSVVYTSSDEELNISLYPIDGYNMDEYDFVCEIFCSPLRKQIVHKKDMERIDASNYRVWMKTSVIGVGNVKVRVLAKIPNAKCDDGYRDVVTYLNPMVEIKD